MKETDLTFDILLEEAVASSASDLHLQAGQKPYLRVHGQIDRLEQYPVISEGTLLRMMKEVMDPEQQRRFAEVQALDFSYALPEQARFRVNFFQQQRLPGAVFRRIPDQIPTLVDLHAPLAMLKVARAEKGLVIVTGATGSGKSTSLAAMIDIINTERASHILTIEDPTEFVHPPKRCLVNQREVGKDTPSFQEALRGALRQDPDVILVGEMRDWETTAIAITAAETGHLVFATLHTNSAPDTIDRIVDQFPPQQQEQIRVQLAATLQAVIAQTLLPNADRTGRVAAFEVMLVNHAIRSNILKNRKNEIVNAIQQGLDAGMQSMDRCLAYLASNGIVDLEVARQKAHEEGDFEQYVNAARQGTPVALPPVCTEADLPQQMMSAISGYQIGGKSRSVAPPAQSAADRMGADAIVMSPPENGRITMTPPTERIPMAPPEPQAPKETGNGQNDVLPDIFMPDE